MGEWSSGSSVVFVDQSAECCPPLDRTFSWWRVGIWAEWAELEWAMRPVPVVVIDILAPQADAEVVSQTMLSSCRDDLQKMTFVEQVPLVSGVNHGPEQMSLLARSCLFLTWCYPIRCRAAMSGETTKTGMRGS